ncbi:MAG TPA: hypothetical protein VIB39_16795 [Candidatus Angelobacter sp.]|jgi:hypothetical protein
MNKRTLIVAGILGFLAPVICAVIDMLLFSAKDSLWADFLVYTLPRIICPAWSLGGATLFWFFAMPVINSATYIAIALSFVKAKDLFAVRHKT